MAQRIPLGTRRYALPRNCEGWWRGRQRRCGAAAVEFAIVAPLFFLLLAGIMEFGQAFRIEHILSSASRRGARIAVLESSTAQEIEQAVKSRCTQTLSVSEDDLVVVVSVNGSSATPIETAESGDAITVEVRIRYTDAAVGFYANLFSNTWLSSECTLEHE